MLFDAIKNNEAMQIHGNGEQTRDFTYVDDVVEATLLAALSGRAVGQVFNIGGGKSIAIGDLAKWVKKETGDLSKIRIVGGEASASSPKSMFSSIEKVQRFSWRPRRSIKKAVEEYVSGEI